jgi:hypothetical protein
VHSLGFVCPRRCLFHLDGDRGGHPTPFSVKGLGVSSTKIYHCKYLKLGYNTHLL